MSRPCVAVIGVGAMGAPVARRIRAAGFELTVCDASEKARAAFAGSGAHLTSDPAECGSADVIVVLVATPGQVYDVLLGSGGVISGVSAGRSPVIAVMSTVSKAVLTDLHERLAERGVRLVDAPVSGGPPRAENGTLTVMVGGAQSDIQVLQPVLESIGSHIVTCGPVGAAQVVKIVNNLVCAANVAISGEAYRLALENGLSLDSIMPVLDTSTGRNFLTPDPAEAVTYFGLWAATRLDFEAVRSIIRKDVGLAGELASAAPGAYPALESLAALLDSLGDETFQNWRMIAAQETTAPGSAERQTGATREGG